jgi:hypothetical protein
MKLYKLTTDNEIFYVYAESSRDAQILVIRDSFPEKLDDELSDLFDVEEVTKAGIIISDDNK